MIRDLALVLLGSLGGGFCGGGLVALLMCLCERCKEGVIVSLVVILAGIPLYAGYIALL